MTTRRTTPALPAKRRRRGFMLLEVLVALTVLTIGITGLLWAMTRTLDYGKRTRAYSTAMYLAQHIMMQEERMYQYSEEIATVNRGTFYEEGLPEFSWESDVSLDEDLLEYTIKVTVSWDHRGRPLSYSLVQLVPAHYETLEDLGSGA